MPAKLPQEGLFKNIINSRANACRRMPHYHVLETLSQAYKSPFLNLDMSVKVASMLSESRVGSLKLTLVEYSTSSHIAFIFSQWQLSAVDGWSPSSAVHNVASAGLQHLLPSFICVSHRHSITFPHSLTSTLHVWTLQLGPYPVSAVAGFSSARFLSFCAFTLHAFPAWP